MFETLLRVAGWLLVGGLTFIVAIFVFAKIIINKTHTFVGEPIPQHVSSFKYNLDNRFLNDEYEWYAEEDYDHAIVEISESLKVVLPNSDGESQSETYIIYRKGAGTTPVTFLLRTKDRRTILNRKTETFTLL